MFAGIPVPQNCGINGKHKINNLCALCGYGEQNILVIWKVQVEIDILDTRFRGYDKMSWPYRHSCEACP